MSGKASSAAVPAPAAPRAAMASVPALDRRQARRVQLARGLFVFALLAWGSLAVFWTTYFHRLDREAREANLRAYAAEQMLLAPRLCTGAGSLPGYPFALATPPLDEEVREFPVFEPPAELCNGQAIVVSPEHRAALRSGAFKRTVMLVGEGTFLIGLLFVCLVALFRLVLSEWRLNRQTEAFVHAVTHELRSPLAGLRALLQSFGALELSAAERRTYAALGLGEIDRLDRQVGNVLLSSRLAGRAWRPHLEDLDLAAALGRLVDRKRLWFEQKGGSLSVDVSEARARMDASALDAILENLVDNAFKYGGERPVVRMGVRTEAERVVVTVSDEGLGLSATDRARVFEKFFRADDGARHQAKGTGLGLFLARQLARACGGDLHVHSDGPRQGATFFLEMKAQGAP